MHFLGYLVSLQPEKDAGVLIDEKVRTSKMVIQVKTLAGKPEDQSSIPRTHRVDEKTNSYNFSSDFHVHDITHAHPGPTNTQNK